MHESNSMCSFISQVLREDELKAKELPVFLGFATSGKVKAEIVYANFGTEEDFEQLKGMGLSVKNKIVIIRLGRVFRGNKVSDFTIQYKIHINNDNKNSNNCVNIKCSNMIGC